jgi:predicted SAM-dependent methyltransferase
VLKLNLGCGTNRLGGWENHDADVDLRKRLPWPNESAKFILLEHVLEHFGCGVGYKILEECWRILPPGGVVRICIPDVTKVQSDPAYTEFIQRAGWGDNPVRAVACYHGHEMLWTYDTLAVVLKSIGFQPKRCSPRVSEHPELCNVEGHHKVVGERINDIETLVVEGTKPG